MHTAMKSTVLNACNMLSNCNTHSLLLHTVANAVFVDVVRWSTDTGLRYSTLIRIALPHCSLLCGCVHMRCSTRNPDWQHKHQYTFAPQLPHCPSDKTPANGLCLHPCAAGYFSGGNRQANAKQVWYCIVGRRRFSSNCVVVMRCDGHITLVALHLFVMYMY